MTPYALTSGEKIFVFMYLPPFLISHQRLTFYRNYNTNLKFGCKEFHDTTKPTNGTLVCRLASL